jgi:hypothetical protein
VGENTLSRRVSPTFFPQGGADWGSSYGGGSTTMLPAVDRYDDDGDNNDDGDDDNDNDGGDYDDDNDWYTPYRLYRCRHIRIDST